MSSTRSPIAGQHENSSIARDRCPSHYLSRRADASAALLAFGAASVVLLLIPGPAVTYIVNRSVADGRSVALASVAGIELGNFVHVIAATVGLSAVLATSATAFTVVKWFGAAYLVGVGMKTLLTRPERLQAEAVRTSYRRAFTQGVVINIFNPKVALFFLSFLPQFIEHGHGPTWLQSLIFGSLFVLLGCLTDGSWAFARKRRPRAPCCAAGRCRSSDAGSRARCSSGSDSSPPGLERASA